MHDRAAARPLLSCLDRACRVWAGGVCAGNRSLGQRPTAGWWPAHLPGPSPPAAGPAWAGSPPSGQPGL